MVEQFKLRDIEWVCNNSVTACEAVFPCFDAHGAIKMVLVLSRRWGWLTAPADKLRHQGMEVIYEGKLEDLFKVSERSIDKFNGLFHFDPWWLTRKQPLELPDAVADRIVQTNLAAATLRGQPVHSVVFEDALDHVERVEVGSSLWRRTLESEQMTAWLSSDPMRSAKQMRREVARTEAGLLLGADDGWRDDLAPDDLYQDTDGPLKTISPQRRVSTPVAVTIGQPDEDENSPVAKHELPSKRTCIDRGQEPPPMLDHNRGGGMPVTGREADLSGILGIEPQEAPGRRQDEARLYGIHDDDPDEGRVIYRADPPQRRAPSENVVEAEAVEVEPVDDAPPPPPGQGGDVQDALQRIRQRIQQGRRR